MRSGQHGYCYQQIHIDAARNATDDFNPFHDRKKWHRIHGNPFGMPIVLGFQIEALIEYLVTLFREQSGEQALIDGHQLHFSNFQFAFADVLRPGEAFHVSIKKTVNRLSESGQLANRIVVKKQGGLVLLGYQRESTAPLCMPDADFDRLAGTDLLDLGLLVIRHHPHVRKIGDGEQRLPRGDDLSRLHRLPGHISVDRGDDVRVLPVELRLREDGLPLVDEGVLLSHPRLALR